MRIALLAMVLAGCASPRPFDVAGKDPTCARSCLASHSQCVSQAGVAAVDAMVSAGVLRSCRNATDACLSTCGAK